MPSKLTVDEFTDQLRASVLSAFEEHSVKNSSSCKQPRCGIFTAHFNQKRLCVYDNSVRQMTIGLTRIQI